MPREICEFYILTVCLAWILAVPSQMIFFRIGPRVFRISSLSSPGPSWMQRTDANAAAARCSSLFPEGAGLQAWQTLFPVYLEQESSFQKSQPILCFRLMREKAWPHSTPAEHLLGFCLTTLILQTGSSRLASTSRVCGLAQVCASNS